MASDLPILLMQAQLGIFGESIGKAAQRADELRAHRGDGRPGDTPAEHNDKQQVESHVQYRGEQQERQRRHAVAHAAQERANKIIEQLRADPGKNDGTIGVGRAIDFRAVRRYIDPCEHWIEQHKRQCRKHHCENTGKDDLRCQRAAHTRRIVRADITRCDYAEARADAKGKLQKDKNERRRIVDTRNFLRCQRLADDGRVADRVDLLQQIRNNDWERECQDRFPAFPLCELHRLEQGR